MALTGGGCAQAAGIRRQGSGAAIRGAGPRTTLEIHARGAGPIEADRAPVPWGKPHFGRRWEEQVVGGWKSCALMGRCAQKMEKGASSRPGMESGTSAFNLQDSTCTLRVPAQRRNDEPAESQGSLSTRQGAEIAETRNFTAILNKGADGPGPRPGRAPPRSGPWNPGSRCLREPGGRARRCRPCRCRSPRPGPSGVRSHR